jgi:hypothetical protein
MPFSQTLKLCRDFCWFFFAFSFFFAFAIFLFERFRRDFLHKNHDNSFASIYFVFTFCFQVFQVVLRHVTTFNVVIVTI